MKRQNKTFLMGVKHVQGSPKRRKLSRFQNRKIIPTARSIVAENAQDVKRNCRRHFEAHQQTLFCKGPGLHNPGHWINTTVVLRGTGWGGRVQKSLGTLPCPKPPSGSTFTNLVCKVK